MPASRRWPRLLTSTELAGGLPRLRPGFPYLVGLPPASWRIERRVQPADTGTGRLRRPGRWIRRRLPAKHPPGGWQLFRHHRSVLVRPRHSTVRTRCGPATPSALPLPRLRVSPGRTRVTIPRLLRSLRCSPSSRRPHPTRALLRATSGSLHRDPRARHLYPYARCRPTGGGGHRCTGGRCRRSRRIPARQPPDRQLRGAPPRSS